MNLLISDFARRKLCSLCLAAALISTCAGLAHADTLQDISKLIKQGQHAQALDQVDKYLVSKPKDAQARFLRGIALTEMNRPTEAIAVFQKLTEDYPELPEPYNNLAVIFAQQKQYEKAKGALEMAIRTHPSYATAHENLGDIYARLASQAYDKALQLDSSNASAQGKLALIRDLMTTTGHSTTQVASKPIETPKPTATTTPTTVALAPVAVTPPPPVATPPAVKPVEAPKPAPVAVATPPVKPTNGASANPSAEISKTLEAWASAWSSKDVKAYLNHYARDFKTPGGMPRAAWETERKQRINKPGAIQVEIDSLHVKADGDSANATFRQSYRSASLKVASTKTVNLVRRDGKWQIQQEQVGAK